MAWHEQEALRARFTLVCEIEHRDQGPNVDASETCFFDSETLGLVQDILSHAGRALEGTYGASERMLWEMQSTRDALDELVEWKARLVRAVEDQAMRMVWERESGGKESGTISFAEI